MEVSNPKALFRRPFTRYLLGATAVAVIIPLAAAQSAAPQSPSNISIGDAPVVILQQPPVTDKNKPQFLGATVLPGRGMAVLQIHAYLPGKGEIDLLNSPPLPQAAKLLDEGDDQFGNQIFKVGGAILLPFANRIRGKLSPDGQTIAANVNGTTLSLPANWSGSKPGAEKHAIHGLMRRSKFRDVKVFNGGRESRVSAMLFAGNFDGHWLSDTDVEIVTTVTHDAFEMQVTAKNVGNRLLPMGIGWHPYFVLPGRDRDKVRLHIPAESRAVMNNYDDTFTTGQRVPVKGSAYDYAVAGGRALDNQYLDDNFSNLVRNADGSTVSEIIDPGANYGLRLITLAPQIRSIQVYAPTGKNFVAIEPQFNLPDPYNKNWGDTDTGMVLLQPRQSVTWRVRLELFTPNVK